jgi:archaeosine synthase
MTEFLIGRGHDGPARVGVYRMGSTKVQTPFLVGSPNTESIIGYATLGRDDRTAGGPMILAVPSPIHDSKSFISGVHEDDSILLPSFPSVSFLGAEAAELMLESQLRFIDEVQSKVDPSRLIVRIPRQSASGKLASMLAEFSSLGVRAAAVLFDGWLGPQDFSALSNRTMLPIDWLSIALGRISPSSVPLLFYLGFDAFDLGYATESASRGVRLWNLSEESIPGRILPRACSCTACVDHGDLRELSRDELHTVLVHHNLNIYQSILSESIQSLRLRRLRWLVESMGHSSTAATSLLRTTDKSLFAFLEEFTPTSGQTNLSLIGPESYNSPTVKRFRDCLASRYTPPEHKKLVLLLPCSARKPYSESKSHRRFIEAIESAIGPMRSSVAELILTSPLGVIPRELERLYPAAYYDIPVTGDWDTEETEIAAEALVTHLQKFAESAVVVAHVSGGYLDVVKSAEDRVNQSIVYTTDQHSPSSFDSLQSLQDVLNDMREVLSLKGGPPSLFDDTLRATADYQFGPGAGEALVPDGARLGGKLYRMVVCRVNKEQTCAFIGDSGSLSLTLEGGRRLIPLHRYWVRFEGRKLEGGTIFAVGISEADSGIRPGDEVIVLNNQDEVIAVGRSEMSGREMCDFRKGQAVSVRHKVK